jgi:autotransporter-associated beta strand protein
MSTISGTITHTVTLSGSGSYASPLTITGTGYVDVASGNAVYGPAAQSWTVVNSGRIETSATVGLGIDLGGGGYVGNSGLVSGTEAGVEIDRAAGTVVNSGTIQGTGGRYPSSVGVVLSRGGTVVNTGAGYITGGKGVEFIGGGYLGNAGLISAPDRGVAVYNGAGTVINPGTIFAGYDGIRFVDGGSIDNSGLITGRSTGVVVYAPIGTATDPGTIACTVSNTGTIVGSPTGANLFSGGTLIDFGTISGSGEAVYLGGSGSNRLVLYPGYRLTGTVKGSGNARNTLELAGTAAGTASGLGSEFINFGSVVVDAGADWILPHSNTLADAATLANSGTLVLTGTLQLGTGGSGGSITGDLVDAGTLVVDENGTVTLAGNLSGPGGLVQEGTGTTRLSGTDDYSGGTKLISGTLELANANAAGSGAIAFAPGAAAVLRIDGTVMPRNPIARLAQPDTIDLAGVKASHFTYFAGVLRLFEFGKQVVAQLALSTVLPRPYFTLKPDGHGGTDVQLAQPTVVASVAPLAAEAVLTANPTETLWPMRSG